VSAFYGDQPLGVSTSLSLAASTKLRSVEALGIGGGGGGASLFRRNWCAKNFLIQRIGMLKLSRTQMVMLKLR
ncbi:hypothetical protein ACFLY4_09845, partial [Chloroflexota bacterium]